MYILFKIVSNPNVNVIKYINILLIVYGISNTVIKNLTKKSSKNKRKTITLNPKKPRIKLQLQSRSETLFQDLNINSIFYANIWFVCFLMGSLKC